MNINTTKLMVKEKIVFLSEMAFDSNWPLLKELSNKYEVYYLVSEESFSPSLGKVIMNNDIECATQFDIFKPFSKFMMLDHVFILRHYSKKEYGVKSIGYKLCCIFKASRFINKLNPKVILNNGARNYQALFMLNRSKVICIVHDPFPHTGEKGFTRHLFEYFLKSGASKYILFNEKQKESFIKHHNINPIKVFNSFLSKYEMISMYGSKESLPRRKNILFWGRISPYKGIEYLIEGFKAYLKETGDVETTLTIGGGGEYYFDVDSAIKDCPQIILYKRYLTMDELADQLAQCAFAVVPYTDATQSGVIMTAFGMKRTVLATRTGGLPEMLEDGELGMLVEPKSANAIKDGIKILMGTQTLIENYEKKIEMMYFNDGPKSWAVSAKKIIECIEA